MDNIIFHSLYNNASLTTLKHSLLYFDNITIPSDAYACSFGENNSHIHFLQLIPEDVHQQIEFLKNEGLLKVHKFGDKNPDAIYKYYGAVVEGINKLGRDRKYSKEQFLEIYEYLNLNPDHPDGFTVINEATIFISAICLMEFSVHEQICCIDNQIIYETLNLGVQGVLQFAKNNISDQNIEFRRIKKNMLAQKVLSLNLPSFIFQTFDDVLEIKEKHKDGLLALDNHLDNLAEKIELSPYDPGFSDAIDRLISRRIQPEIDDLTRSITFSPNSLVKRIYDPLKNFGLSFGFSNSFPAYTKEIAAAGITLTVIESIFKDYFETKKRIKESPYNLFISLRSK